MPGKTQPKSFSGRKYHSISDLRFVFLFGPENGVTLLFENLLMSVKLGEPLFSKKKICGAVSSLHYIATYFKELMRKILATNQIGLVLPMYYHSPYSDA